MEVFQLDLPEFGEKSIDNLKQAIEASKQQGREMVLEAQQVRQRMLDDLARRRQALRQQIEQLQAGRDRISAAYDIVRETLAVATEELDVALPEAQLAAEVASLQIVDSEPDATVTSIVTAEELGVPVIDVSPADRPRNVEIPAEPKSSAPKLTVVPPVQEPKTEKSSDSASESAEPEQLGDASPVAEDPREGRHSSSVRVVRTSRGKAADVFARLRKEGEDEVAQSGEGPEAEMTAPIVDTAIAETKIGATDDVSEEAEADSDADQAFIVERNAAVAAIESSLARRIKRELSDEQNELLSTLRSVKGNMTAIAFLPTPESQLERYEDIALPALADAAEMLARSSHAALRICWSCWVMAGGLSRRWLTKISRCVAPLPGTRRCRRPAPCARARHRGCGPARCAPGSCRAAR